MKIALPIWNNRISPLFDTACRVLIWDFEAGSRGEWDEHDLRGLIPPMKVRKIKELGAEVLICGAVSNPVAYLVESAEIKLIPWISGPVDEVIEAYRKGQLDSPRYFMPGCGRMRARLGRSGGRHGQAGARRGRGKGYGSAGGEGPT